MNITVITDSPPKRGTSTYLADHSLRHTGWARTFERFEAR